MRSSPDLKVRIPADAGRSCTGAPWGPCSSQSGASAVGLGSAHKSQFHGWFRGSAGLEGFNFLSSGVLQGLFQFFKAS